jgi:S-DNA-T family DNA segregation ATPase FtsK/SpoIIIE
MPKNRTRPGWEMRAAAWAARHPSTVLTPAAALASTVEFGALTTGITAGSVAAGLTLGGLSWMRAHPVSFTRHAAPRVRRVHRRWVRYVGPRWRDTLIACDLVRTHPRTGELTVPRVIRVSSPTPTIDRVTVKIAPGQSLRTWQNAHDELAAMLKADSLGITLARAQVIVLTVVRGNPFTEPIPAPEIPDEVGEVDLTALVLGETEYGDPWTEPLVSQNWLWHGTMGSGKSSGIWCPLRSMGPLIREGLVRVWMADLKGGMETAQARPLFHRWADHVEDPDDDEDNPPDYAGEAALDLVRDFRNEMRARQIELRAQGDRKFSVSHQTPFHVLMIDELAMATALGSRYATNELNKLLAEIMTQGRAPGFAVCAYVQEATKDIVPMRELFTRRVCLATTSDSYVDMVLGEGMRDRGAVADEIPIDEDHAGIGFRVDSRSRNPVRVRAGHVTDDEIAELVRTCAPRPDDGGSVISLPVAV